MKSPIQAMYFRGDDEMDFKRTFAIQFLASLDAVNYASNCQSAWNHHHQPVEDAKYLADQAWETWKQTIGVVQ